MNTRGLKKYQIFDIPITSEVNTEILKYIEIRLTNGRNCPSGKNGKPVQPLVVYTPNPEQIVYALHHPWFTKLLKRADILLPDGTGLVWASRVLGNPGSITRYSGVACMEELVSWAAKNSVTVGLIGGKADVAEEALKCLRRRHPKLAGWSRVLPTLDITDTGTAPTPRLSVDGREIDTHMKEVVEKIRTAHTQMVFVALGAPKQELFIRILADEFIRIPQTNGTDSILCMAVGGAFDEIAGKVRRTPVWVDRAGLKWLFRLIQEPWRWRRQLALGRFVLLVAGKKFGIYIP